ncbi:Cytidylyltransferase [Arboricoccus pini]|uniref:Cytidylyltransferase n=1 Tax=Arboricoccus pini TaxID=1963835 RepID=A0A212RDX4_9PROT|nr:hypothetical protein [Arboricoccus pini]SNB70372.1 Cytidylyltransferase [Arboricoccus pini]
MFAGKAVLSVVPARGGSKGIRDKNLQDVAGRSLVAWTTDAIEWLPWIDQALLSTDDPAIAAEGRRVGPPVPALWFWPNTDAGSDTTSHGTRRFRAKHAIPHVQFFKTLAPEDFLNVLKCAIAIAGNSGVSIGKCAYPGVRANDIGSRQRDRGAYAIDVPHEPGGHKVGRSHRDAPRTAPSRSDPWRRQGRPAEATILAHAALTFLK